VSNVTPQGCRISSRFSAKGACQRKNFVPLYFLQKNILGRVRLSRVKLIKILGGNSETYFPENYFFYIDDSGSVVELLHAGIGAGNGSHLLAAG
jgi:hypothetical protein